MTVSSPASSGSTQPSVGEFCWLLHSICSRTCSDALNSSFCLILSSSLWQNGSGTTASARVGIALMLAFAPFSPSSSDRHVLARRLVLTFAQHVAVLAYNLFVARRVCASMRYVSVSLAGRLACRPLCPNMGIPMLNSCTAAYSSCLCDPLPSPSGSICMHPILLL